MMRASVRAGMEARWGVIFDLDGVLVDSAGAHRRAWQQLGAEVGTPFTDALFDRSFGQRNESIIPIWLGVEVPAPRTAALADRKEQLYRDAVWRGAVRVYDGVAALVDALRAAGARLAIASSGPRANVELLVEVMGVGARIDVLVASEDVLHGKPDPEAFLLAASGLGVAPASCAVIEDSVHGIEAAVAAGMLAVAVLTSTPHAALAAAGAAVFLPEVGGLDAAGLAAIVRQRGC